MEPEFWYICPIWFIPSTLLWCCLMAFCEHIKLSEKLSQKHLWHKRRVEKWIGRIVAVISLVVILIVLILISVIFRFNLLSWEPM